MGRRRQGRRDQAVAEALDPRGFTVETFAAPKGEVRTHLLPVWRFLTRMPRAGHLSIFDRSYYGRVLVERVEGFCSTPEWTRAYREINEFEAQQTAFGIVILQVLVAYHTRRKLLRRFKKGNAIPIVPTSSRKKIRAIAPREFLSTLKRWKRCLNGPPHPARPGLVVEANDKYYARLKIARTLSRAMKNAP